MTSKQELEKKQKAAPPATASDLGEWGGGQVVTSNDIVIPKILPLNYMSEKVKNKQGEYGEFRDTLNNAKFGDLNKGFEFIPILMEKKWIEFDLVANKAGAKKREFKSIVPIVDTPGDGYNDDLPYSEPGLERDRVLDFYVLIPEEIVSGGSVPYVLSFKRTSLKAGKKLATQMHLKNRMAGKNPAAVACTLSGLSVQNDDGEYVVQDVTPSRESTVDEMAAALHWFKLIGAGKTSVHDYEEGEHGSSQPEAQGNKASF